MKKEICSCLRVRVIEFLIQSTQHLQLSPIVKYTALSLFSDQFYPRLLSKTNISKNSSSSSSWLLNPPLTESNLQLFTLVTLWISSKIHDSPPLNIKSLKLLADKSITDQVFTINDFCEAELVLLKILKFEIGMLNRVIFRFVDDLVVKLKEVAKIGEELKIEACMDLLDLLYEKSGEVINSDRVILLAAGIVVAAYVITVRVQRNEFPIVGWVKFVTKCNEEDVVETVRNILMHVFEAS